jgi:hypothetical protein
MASDKLRKGVIRAFSLPEGKEASLKCEKLAPADQFVGA